MPQTPKINPPKLPKIVERHRLFHQLDQARKRSIVWINAPPGMGKTTLVASYLQAKRLKRIWYQVDGGDADPASFFHYMQLAFQKLAPRSRQSLPTLTPEYLPALPIFTRRFFEHLYNRLRPPAVLVFDNYQELPATAPMQDIVQLGCTIIPDGLNLIVMSREEPPSPFARLLAGQHIAHLGQESLLLTEEETRAIISLHATTKKWKPTRAVIDELQQKTQGWVAGLVLHLEHLKDGPKDIPDHFQQTPQVVFDYLAVEVLKTVDHVTQDFLLKTACLPSMTVSLAEEVTQNSRAKQILDSLHRGRYFTERRVEQVATYQYHPLFRACLQARLKELMSPTDFQQHQIRSAHALEGVGRIEEAMGLLQEAGEVSEQIRLVCAQAPLLLSQGRVQTLERWLCAIPEHVVEGTPWLQIWLGSARQMINPKESESLFKNAYALFKTQENPMGICLAWCGAVESHLLLWDNFHYFDFWIDELNVLLKKGLRFPNNQIAARVIFDMFSAMVYRRAHEPTMDVWADRAGKTLVDIPELGHQMLAGFKLIQFYGTRGFPLRAGEVFSSLRRIYQGHTAPSQPATATYWAAEAYLAWCQGDAPGCIEITNRGLQMAQEGGLAFWTTFFPLIGVHAALCVGDLGQAKEYLTLIRPMCEHRANFIGAYFHGLRSWANLLEMDINQAEIDNHISTQYIERSGANNAPEAVHQVMKAQLLYERGADIEPIREAIGRAREIGEAFKSSMIEFRCRILEAQIALGTPNEDAADKSVAGVLSYGRSHSLTFTYMWLPRVVARLCVHALRKGIEIDYARYLIRAGQLVPDDPTEVGEHWPWPVKIRTLGFFTIEVNGKPVEFSRKAQSRPLAMLKAIITMGGRDVPEYQLSEVLWPEADGDAAHQAWATTLHRLRDLLGHQGSILRREGRLTLNSQICWVDAFAFEDILSGNFGSPAGTPPGLDLQTQQQALTLYHGPFLKDEEEAWIFGYRARLRGKFIRHVGYLRAELEALGQGRQAIEWLEKAIQKEPLVEGLYQQLMDMLARQGHAAQVATVYDQCREALHSAFGSEPSLETRQAFKQSQAS